MTANARRSKPTPAAIRQALRHVEQLARPTDREKAERRMRTAKARYTEATEASMRGDQDAGERVDAALAEVNAAREALRLIDQPNEGSSA